MGVSLSKGGNVAFTKEAMTAQAAANPNDPALAQLANAITDAGLQHVTVGLGWDVRTTTGADFDLDAAAILANANGKVVNDKSFVFYGNLESSDGSVKHLGDNLTGDGGGDDEQIKVDLSRVPADVDKIVFPVSIYEAESRQQGFGQVRNAFIRFVNDETGMELARYDLTEDASTESAMVFGELYRNGTDWKFRAVGQGYATGLRGIAQDFGVSL